MLNLLAQDDLISVFLASRYGRDKVVKLLLAAGADVTKANHASDILYC